jgi:hypothetical protein
MQSSGDCLVRIRNEKGCIEEIQIEPHGDLRGHVDSTDRGAEGYERCGRNH